MLLSLLIASIFNKLSFILQENVAKIIIFAKILIELIVILIYYIGKVTIIIPFMFHYTDKYKLNWKSKDGETMIGTTVAFALIFLTIVTKEKYYFYQIIYKIMCYKANFFLKLINND